MWYICMQEGAHKTHKICIKMLCLIYKIHSFLFACAFGFDCCFETDTHEISCKSRTLYVVQTGLKLLTVFLPQPFGYHHIQLKVTFERLVHRWFEMDSGAGWAPVGREPLVFEGAVGRGARRLSKPLFQVGFCCELFCLVLAAGWNSSHWHVPSHPRRLASALMIDCFVFS